MSEEFDNIEDLDEEMEVITMVDDETGEVYRVCRSGPKRA